MSIDFIIKLPILRIIGLNDKFNSIFVIVDRKGKMAYFVPYREAINTKEFAFIFHRTVTSRHIMPAEIILDRDKLFISKF